MFCGATQSGILKYYDYDVAKWKCTSSKLDWPGPMPKAWERSMNFAPDRVEYERAISVGWMHLRLDKTRHHSSSNVFIYTVYAWGFPIPCMRHDSAFKNPGWPDSYNDVDKKSLQGVTFTLGKSSPEFPVGVIPIVPWWPGFILNTLLWSLFLAWITKTFQRARWFKRMQKGQCIKCKYQVGSLRTCPECGTEKPCP